MMEALNSIELQTLEICKKTISQQKSLDFAYQLYHIALNGLGVLNYQNPFISGEQHLIENILTKLIHDPFPVIFDVGAYHGAYSRLLHNQFPNARIHSFEPHPKNYQILEQIDIPNIVCHNLGLGERKGIFTIYDRSDMNGSSHASLYNEVIQDIHKVNSVQFKVEITTIDEVIEKENIQRIDFLKIDTEGHELAVLIGASKALKKGIIQCIQFEFNEMNVVSRTFLKDFKDILKGFVFYRLLPTGLFQLGDQPLLTEIFAFQNILAIPSNLMQ